MGILEILLNAFEIRLPLYRGKQVLLAGTATWALCAVLSVGCTEVEHRQEEQRPNPYLASDQALDSIVATSRERTSSGDAPAFENSPKSVRRSAVVQSRPEMQG